MSSKQELVYSTTGHHINKDDGMFDVTYARSLYNGHPVRQEQLVRIAVATLEMDSTHIEHPIMTKDRNSDIHDICQDVFEIQGLDLNQNLNRSRIGRKAIAVVNLFAGSYDQDGFEIMMVEPFKNTSVLALLDTNTSQLKNPDFFTERIWIR